MEKHRTGQWKGTTMATAQHPAPGRTAVHHNFDWLWISLSVILVALIAGAVAWAIFRPAATVPPLPAEVTGFEYTQEATTGMVVQPGVTGEYFGYSGELYSEIAATGSVAGITLDPTAMWGTEFSNPGELYPEVVAAQITDPGEAASLFRSVDAAIEASHLAELGGFEFGHEVTPGHVASPGVTGQYFGYSGEMFADD